MLTSAVGDQPQTTLREAPFSDNGGKSRQCQDQRFGTARSPPLTHHLPYPGDVLKLKADDASQDNSVPGMAKALVGMKLKSKRMVVVARSGAPWILYEIDLQKLKAKSEKKEKKERAAAEKAAAEKAAAAAAAAAAPAPVEASQAADEEPDEGRNSLQDRMARVAMQGGGPQFVVNSKGAAPVATAPATAAAAAEPAAAAVAPTPAAATPTPAPAAVPVPVESPTVPGGAIAIVAGQDSRSHYMGAQPHAHGGAPATDAGAAATHSHAYQAHPPPAADGGTMSLLLQQQQQAQQSLLAMQGSLMAVQNKIEEVLQNQKQAQMVPGGIMGASMGMMGADAGGAMNGMSMQQQQQQQQQQFMMMQQQQQQQQMMGMGMQPHMMMGMSGARSPGGGGGGGGGEGEVNTELVMSSVTKLVEEHNALRNKAGEGDDKSAELREKVNMLMDKVRCFVPASSP